MNVPLGVKRLDDLLGGGVPPGSATLVRGPAFSGKEVLGRRFVLTGLDEGVPAILVLTDASAADASAALAQVDPRVPDHEADGLLRYVDAYTASIGAEGDHPAARYVESVLSLNAFVRVMNEVQRDLLGDHDHHRVVFDSATTMIVETNARTTFRFLQVLLGRTRQAGGTSLVLIDDDVHEASDVQLIAHLAAGAIQTAVEDDRAMLRVEGLGLNQSPGWVPYAWSEERFEITGTFGVGLAR